MAGPVDNIPETAEEPGCTHYSKSTITGETFFDYIINGVLHASRYRERFANYRPKEFRCIPFVPDFRALAEAGRRLSELNLNHDETCREYPLELPRDHGRDLRLVHLRIGTKKTKWTDDDRKTLIVKDHLRLTGIRP